MRNNKIIATLPGGTEGQSLRGGRHFGDGLFFSIAFGSGLIIILVLIGIVIVLNVQAMPAMEQFGWPFLTSMAWDPVRDLFGALPAIYGTLLSSIVGLIIAVPISLASAIFLAELAPEWIQKPASFLIEMLAAIPSVIIGLWGLFVMVPVIRSPIESWLGSNLGFLGLFQGPPFGVGFLSAGIILAIMIIPIITAVSREVIRAVPDTQREAMLALGATRWETINRVVLAYGRSGLVGAVILGLGRAMGETMAVTMVIGNSYAITSSLFSPGVTIASKIASEFSEAAGGLYLGSLVELALVLFVITLLVNIVARLLVWRTTAFRAAGE